MPGLTIIGTAPDKAAVISFTMDGIHPHDLGTILDSEGVAVRTGHHCAMPVMEFFDVPATARASFACYSRESDIDALVARARQGARGVRADGPQGSLSRGHPRPQQAVRGCSAGSSRRIRPPTATIRCAATGCTSRCGSKAIASSDLRFEGKGCAISVASASLMCEAVKGKERADIAHLFNEIHEVLTHHDAPVPDDLGKLAALSGVRDFPVRVKCASLCWHTLNAALDTQRRDR